MLLHDATRRAAGVQLKGQVRLDTRLNISTLILLVFQKYELNRENTCVSLQVVIIDEAHNLSDTLSCIHSAELTGAQVHICRTHIPGLNDAFLKCECFCSSAAPILSSPSTLIDLSEFRLVCVNVCTLHVIRRPVTVPGVYVCAASGADWRQRTWCTSSRFCLWLRGLSGCWEVSVCEPSGSGQCHNHTQTVWYCR